MTDQDPETTFVTPIGRIVGGSLSRQKTKKYDGTPLNHPEWYVALAVPRADAEKLVAQIRSVAAVDFAANPSALDNPNFFWKFDDGDSEKRNSKGVAPNTREGWPGHVVFHISNTFAFPTFGPDRQEIDPESIKTGDYVRLRGRIKGSGKTVNPSVYLDLTGVRFIRSGEKIVTGFGPGNADDMFEDQPVGEAPAGPPTSIAGSGAVDHAHVPTTPAHDIVSNVIAPPPPPPATGPTLTAKGVSEGCDVAAWLASGWTIEALRTQGFVQ